MKSRLELTHEIPEIDPNTFNPQGSPATMRLFNHKQEIKQGLYALKERGFNNRALIDSTIFALDKEQERLMVKIAEEYVDEHIALTTIKRIDEAVEFCRHVGS